MFTTESKVRDVNIKILGHPIVLGIRRSSVIISMPGLMKGHVTLMKYSDVNNPNYGKFDMHTTNGDMHKTISGPYYDYELIKRLQPVQNYFKKAEVTKEDFEWRSENFYTANNIENLIQMERAKRQLNINFNFNDSAGLKNYISIVRGDDIFKVDQLPNAPTSMFTQESNPENLLLSKNGHYYFLNKNRMLKELSDAFKMDKSAFDILK